MLSVPGGKSLAENISCSTQLLFSSTLSRGAGLRSLGAGAAEIYFNEEETSVLVNAGDEMFYLVPVLLSSPPL